MNKCSGSRRAAHKERIGLKMKRYRIRNKFRFTAFVTLCLLAIVFIFGSLMGFFNVQAAEPEEYVSYQVRSGDTLWNIARSYGPSDQDVRATISAICAINDVSPNTLRAGQVLQILAGK